MAQNPAPGDAELARLHADWHALHSRLRVHEQLLSDALALYATGEGPRPDSIIAEVEQMRAECSARFRRMMAVVKG
ncbi:MAG TPA: hypothetical protein VGD76_08335 [Ramlibacter sp.]